MVLQVRVSIYMARGLSNAQSRQAAMGLIKSDQLTLELNSEYVLPVNG